MKQKCFDPNIAINLKLTKTMETGAKIILGKIARHFQKKRN